MSVGKRSASVVPPNSGTAPQQEPSLWSPLFDASSDCVKLLTARGTVERVNAVGRTALGLENVTDYGMDWVELLPSSIRDLGIIALKDAVAGHEAQFFGRTVSEAGEQTWNNLLTPLFHDGRLSGIICTSRDVSREQQAYVDALRQGQIDELTQIDNRRAILEALDRAVIAAARSRGLMTVMMLDVDDLKTINDRYGHRVGDDVLVRVAGALRHACPEQWSVGRIGGDEFMVVAPATQGVELEIESLHAAVDAVPGFPAAYTSIGVASAFGPGINPDNLIAQADADLYRQKRRRELLSRSYRWQRFA